jgi:hypothetical protein
MGTGADYEQADQLAPESLADWDWAGRAINGRAPFSVLMDYALGLWAWTWRKEHPDAGEEPFEIQTPPLCLIALAGYHIAASKDIHDVHRTPLDEVAALLSNDDQARHVATIEPGHPDHAEGGLRDNDRQALTEAGRPGSDLPWRRWREHAVHAVNGHLSGLVVTKFYERLTQVRAMRIRRGWYDYPELPPTHDPDAPNDERC